MTKAVTIEISIQEPAWESLGLNEIARMACEAGAKVTAMNFVPVVSLLATNDAQISQLNAQFREKTEATNVLSWPSEDLATAAGMPPLEPRDPEIGDIALSYETCLREAAEQSKSVHDHVKHLVLHGFLHLLGYDHIEDEDATLMEALEIKALETLGIANPYK